MSTIDGLVLALLSVALVLGFFLGVRFGRRRNAARDAQEEKSGRRYIEGINQLLNEQPDAALDAFISSFDVNNDTLETHFALGAMLRKRGEADRAIRIHQNLMARPSLTPEQQHTVQLELALDYMHSGLLDRAESIFTSLIDSATPEIRRKALEKLAEIYQDENDWEQALEVADKLCAKKNEAQIPYWRSLQSHFCCELAEQSIEENNIEKAEEWIQKGLSFNKKGNRVNFLLAKIKLLLGQEAQAIKILSALIETDPDYASEALSLLAKAYESSHEDGAWHKYLIALYDKFPMEALLPQVADALMQEQGERPAISFLVQELKEHPSLALASGLLSQLVENDGELDLKPILQLFESHMQSNGKYLCAKCGFTGHHHYWQCPTCKSWDSVHNVPLAQE